MACHASKRHQGSANEQREQQGRSDKAARHKAPQFDGPIFQTLQSAALRAALRQMVAQCGVLVRRSSGRVAQRRGDPMGR
jgi:predicted lipoprotein